ncbi:MAG: hypothetical protein IJX12_03145 [Lachnospiraceae bacterium]|nr:hypothetical protein [Lachnospiraceae bacterium]
MDNFNGQYNNVQNIDYSQQSYGTGYQMPQQSYGNGYQMSQQSYDTGYQMNQQPYGNGYIVGSNEEDRISLSNRILNASTIFTLISATLILVGLLIPMIDFSHFHQEIDLQYNIMKLCKNIRLVSPVWTALPVGIIIGIVLLYILAFVRIPYFRLIPCIVVLSMFIIMLADMNNLITWADELLNSETMQEICGQEFVINKTEVLKSLRAGIYLMVAGTITGIISSFIKPSTK